MAEEATATATAPKTKAAPKRKTAAKKTTAKRKTAAKKNDVRATAIQTSRNALRAGLGVYGKAYDQMIDQFENLQKQVDDAQDRLDSRRKQAEDLYKARRTRGTGRSTICS